MSRMTSPVPSKVWISSRSGRLSLTSSVTWKISSEPWFGPVCGGRVGERELAVGRHLGADVERVRALALDRLELVVERVDDRVVGRRRAARRRSSFVDHHEDAEVGGAGLRRRLADQVLGVLGVVGVEEAGDLDVVVEPGELDRLALGDLARPPPRRSRRATPARASAASASRANRAMRRRMAGGSICDRLARLAGERRQPVAAARRRPARPAVALGELAQARRARACRSRRKQRLEPQQLARARSKSSCGSVQKVTVDLATPGEAPSASSQTVNTGTRFERPPWPCSRTRCGRSAPRSRCPSSRPTGAGETAPRRRRRPGRAARAGTRSGSGR